MKIKPEHLEHIKEVTSKFLHDNPRMVTDYENGRFDRSRLVKDLQQRFCFDLLHFSGLTKWVCAELYSYVGDDHIYTALKSVCPEVKRMY